MTLQIDSAVDIEYLAGNVRRLGTRDESDNGGDLLNSHEPAERDLRVDLILHALGKPLDHFGLGEAGRNTVRGRP